jgi:hypothetical protein|tara:strand:+ start:2898 stop:4175 length:1278 start_codon:yes stop_codon:yes gene_type:complete
MTQSINTKYDNIQVHLRSDDPDLATAKSESSINFQFRRIINIPTGTKAVVSVLNAQIPNTFYNITKRCRLRMYIDPTVPYTATTPPNINLTYNVLEIGQFSLCDFTAWLNKWPKIGVVVPPVPDNYYPVWAIDGVIGDTHTGKWIAQQPAGGGGAWNIPVLYGMIEYQDPLFDYAIPWKPLPLDDDNYLNILRFLGLESSESYCGNYQQQIANEPRTRTFNPYWAREIPDFTGHHNIYLGTDLITNSVDSLSFGGEHILTKIPVSAPFGSMIHYNGETRAGTLLNQQFLSDINLEIQDHHNHIINLNGVRWNITLLIQFVDAEEQDEVDHHMKTPDAIRATPLANQHKLRAANKNRKAYFKHKIKRYFDSLINPKELKLDIMNHGIGKVPILQGLTGIVSGGDPPNDIAPAGVGGIDTQMTQPLP